MGSNPGHDIYKFSFRARSFSVINTFFHPGAYINWGTARVEVVNVYEIATGAPWELGLYTP